MPNNCTDCRDSILNNQTSTIGQPSCNDNCSEDISCEGIGTYSNCVEVNVALDCSETNVGDNLSTVLQAIDTKLCQSTQNNCTVKVSAEDCGCGYLENKISAGVGITITKITQSPSNCQTLQINTNPATLVWNNITLPSTFTTISGFQIPQYSNKDELGRVWFRGSFTISGGNSMTAGSIVNLTTVLPVGSRPLFNRVCSGGYYKPKNTSASIDISPSYVIFLNTGVIAVKNIQGVEIDGKSVITLDGFYIDVN